LGGFWIGRSRFGENVDFIASAHIFIVLSSKVMRSGVADILRPAALEISMVREGDHWGDLGVDGWMTLGWISRRWGGMWVYGLDWVGPG